MTTATIAVMALAGIEPARQKSGVGTRKRLAALLPSPLKLAARPLRRRRTPISFLAWLSPSVFGDTPSGAKAGRPPVPRAVARPDNVLTAL